MKIGIVGRKKDTYNYEYILHTLKVDCVTSLTIGELASCQGLLFPGGGDITPDLFGQTNQGSLHMDTELDLLQLRAFQAALRNGIPMLGICKGMQLINVGLGGTLRQHLTTADLHTAPDRDLYHETTIATGSFLYSLYGESAYVNSKHHQSVDQPGSRLLPVQWCPMDHCVEALVHTELPILGVQWHPERLDPAQTSVTAFPLFQYFLSFVRYFPTAP
ncbi:MAG: gamma-glutamyl-gamma-aminobutyrate hydrolase family protein [Lachnospiraceae bacterium]|nr:gamma-glutamyl-gamma-aminobutyrate hydrolase family protein [Lachnospiraceae bacterium]